MIISISGKGASGKSTVAKLLAEKLHMRHYSIGDLMRELAETRGVSILQLNRFAETDSSIDKWLDKRQEELAMHDNFIIDSRLAFRFIPDSIKIFLDIDDNVAATRIFTAPPRQGETPYKTIAEARKALIARRTSEIKRLRKYYHLNPYDKKHYDFVVDTTLLSPEQVCNKIIIFLKKRKVL